MSLNQINLNELTIEEVLMSLMSVNEYVSFELVKSTFEDLNINVREVKTEGDLKNLYLLVSKVSVNCTPLQLECNGVILEKETNKIVCMCQNKFTILSNKQEVTDLLKNNSETQIEYCEDGTVMRVYNYNDTWYTATTKCIDARNSYWSSQKTFDEMFWETFGVQKITLDKNSTYSFVLIHKENRIVVKHSSNYLIYISNTSNLTKEEDFINPFSFNATTKITDTNNLECDNKRGIIIRVKNNIFQYDFDTYTKIKYVRGNVPMINMRYLELLDNPDNLALLESNYPENLMMFSMIKHCMENLYKQIHNLYYQSHIKHSITVTEDHKFYRCLKQLHGIHKKQGVIITLDEVVKKINSLDKNIIKKLLGWVC